MANRSWTDIQLIDAVRSSVTKSEVLRKLGLEVRPGNYRTVDVHIERMALSLSHMVGKAHGTSVPRNTIALKDILVDRSSYLKGPDLKRKMIREGLLKNECDECGQKPFWKGKYLVMVLDHINERRSDNRKENLRLLCPNCNSQQATFCRGERGLRERTKRFCEECGKELGKHAKDRLCAICRGKRFRKVERPSKGTLEKQVSELGFEGTSRLYGVTGNAVRKWLK